MGILFFRKVNFCITKDFFLLHMYIFTANLTGHITKDIHVNFHYWSSFKH